MLRKILSVLIAGCLVGFVGFDVALAFIPRSIQKVCVLDFSGPDGGGIEIASQLRSQLRNQGLWAITDEGVMTQLQLHYPYLFEQEFGPKVIRDLGKLLNVDAVLVGHVGRLQWQERVVSDQSVPALQTDVVLDFGYRLFETEQAQLLEQQQWTWQEPLSDRRLGYMSENEKKLATEQWMGKAATAVVDHIQLSRTGFDLRPPGQPLKLSDNSKEWANQPLLLRDFGLYSGAIAPEKESDEFDRADWVWLNIRLDNLRQTAKGEIWLQAHATVMDPDNDVVLDLPYWVDRRMIVPPNRDARTMPLTLRFRLPAGAAKGAYQLQVVCLDRIVSQSVQMTKKFNIK